MKRQLLLLSVCLLSTGFSAFGQSTANTHIAPSTITKSTVLSGILQKITSREGTMISGSRATAAQASSELKDLYTAYSTALNEQIRVITSETELKELNQELRYAEKRKAELTTNR